MSRRQTYLRKLEATGKEKLPSCFFPVTLLPRGKPQSLLTITEAKQEGVYTLSEFAAEKEYVELTVSIHLREQKETEMKRN